MRLQNELYTLLDWTDDQDKAVFTVRLRPESLIYKAHFPSQPITPGVCIVQMAQELMEKKVGQDLEVVAVKKVKFLSVIEPKQGAVLTVEVSRMKCADDTVSASVAVKEDDDVKTKISFTCRRR